MSLFSPEDELTNWFRSLPEEIQDDFARVTGIVFDSLQGFDAKRAVLEDYRQKTRLKLAQKRQDEIRGQEQEFRVRVAREQAQAFAEIIANALSQMSGAFLEHQGQMTKKIEELARSLETNYGGRQLPSVGGEPSHQAAPRQFSPPSLSYTNCIRYHDPTPEHPERRPGPARCVLTIPRDDGIHMRCIVAYVSQNQDDTGFARLPYQIFHAELLRQGDCPRPLSRSVSRRIPGLSWLFARPDICPLADGDEHIMEYGEVR